MTLSDAAGQPERGSPDRERRPEHVIVYDATHGKFQYALNDLKASLAEPGLIATIVKQDFFDRYHGTAFGAFWITVTTAMIIGGLGLVYSQIFGLSIHEYFPFVSIGIIMWTLISGFLQEGVAVFSAGAGLYSQARIPKTMLVFKAMGAAAVAFGFRAIVLIFALPLVGIFPGPGAILISLAGLLIVFWTGFWATLFVGVLGARFTDLRQLVPAILRVLFFLTPIFWHADRLGKYAGLINFNPFYHLLHIVRAPLLGETGIAESFMWSIGIAIVATLAGGHIFGIFARRLPYWVN